MVLGRFQLLVIGIGVNSSVRASTPKSNLGLQEMLTSPIGGDSKEELE